MEHTKVSPLIVIVGPTASGKTALGIDLAKQFNGEIICADSRTVYQGMDIGTAKPTVLERQHIPHHLLDVVRPDQTFTVADFQREAQVAIADISSRGKLPILVGGSGLYINSVVYEYNFRAVNSEMRSRYADANVEELQKLLVERKIPLPENSQNKRYLLRSLEAGQASKKHHQLRPQTLVIGIAVDSKVLQARISQRIAKMLDDGLLDEVKRLKATYAADLPPMQAPAYKSFIPYLNGSCTLLEAAEKFAQYDRQLAKKQRTWFKRNNSIHWLSDPSEAVDLVTKFLNTLGQ